MQFTRKPRRQPTINIISLIDILVVLLIFYIATTVFKKSQPQIRITVPSSTTGKAAVDLPPSIIYVTADGKFFLEDQPIEEGALASTLVARVNANPKFKIAMQADKAAPFGAITKVMDAAHQANISELPTVVDTKGSGTP